MTDTYLSGKASTSHSGPQIKDVRKMFQEEPSQSILVLAVEPNCLPFPRNISAGFPGCSSVQLAAPVWSRAIEPLRVCSSRGAGFPTDLAALLDSHLLLHHGLVHEALRCQTAPRGADLAIDLLLGDWTHSEHPGGSQCKFSRCCRNSIRGCSAFTKRSKPPSLLCLVVPQLTNKIVFVVSFVGNRGTFIRGYKAMIMDVEFLYHVGYIVTSVLGLFVHELFYSILVQ